MITGKIANLEKYIGSIDANIIHRFIDTVKANPAKGIGVWTELDNELRGLILYKSAYKVETFEQHQKYQDIHIVLEGMDQMYFGSETEKNCTTEYVDKDDYALYTSKTIGHINILPNHFALLETFELHSNLIEDENTLKIVIKRIPKNG